jgi:hypothetical protein
VALSAALLGAANGSGTGSEASPAQDTLRALAEYEVCRGNLAQAEEIYTARLAQLRLH